MQPVANLTTTTAPTTRVLRLCQRGRPQNWVTITKVIRGQVRIVPTTNNTHTTITTKVRRCQERFGAIILDAFAFKKNIVPSSFAVSPHFYSDCSGRYIDGFYSYVIRNSTFWNFGLANSILTISIRADFFYLNGKFPKPKMALKVTKVTKTKHAR